MYIPSRPIFVYVWTLLTQSFVDILVFPSVAGRGSEVRSMVRWIIKQICCSQLEVMQAVTALKHTRHSDTGIKFVHV